MASTLGLNNPLRYRGYVYDRETGLYYLQSRYYDPEMGRFINADAFTSTGQGVLGNNMFAYCQNNPVNQQDTSGQLCVDAFGVNDNPLANFDKMLGSHGGGGGLTGNAVSSIASAIVLLFGGTILVEDTLENSVYYAKKSKKSGKEKSDDKPSWVSPGDIDLGKSAQSNATDLLNRKHGEGNWKKGPTSEFNIIVKWINRGLKAFIINWLESLMEEYE